MVRLSVCSFLLVVAIAVFAREPAIATLIIVRQTPEEIVAGADSFRSYHGDSTTTGVCKLHQVGSTFYGIAGIGARKDSGEDMFGDIIDNRLKKNGSLLSKVNDIGKQLMPALNRVLEAMRRYNATDFSKKYSDTEPLQVTIFGFENGTSHVFTIAFDPIKNVSDPVDVTGTIEGTSGKVATFASGATRGIEHLLRDEKVWEIGTVRGVRKLIEYQSGERPDLVGGDIHILRVNKTQARWENKIPACREIYKY